MPKPALVLSRPAAIGALSVAAGILLGRSVPAYVSVNTGAVLSAAVAIGLLAVVAAVRRQRGRLLPNTVAPHTIGAALLLASVGFVRISNLTDAKQQIILDLIAKPTTTGIISEPPTQTSWSTRFRLEVPDPRGTIQVDVSAAARDQWRPILAAGDTVVLRGPLDVRIRKRNPADFDYGAFLFSRSVLGAVTVSDPETIVSVVEGPTRGPAPAIARLREQILARISGLANERSGPVLRALILDDRTGIDEGLRNALSRSGLMHLLSVSGLHVMLVGFALHRTLFSVLVRLRVPWQVVEWTRTVATIVLLCLYAALTGNAPPVTRAVIMASLLMGQTLVRRQSDTLNTLGAAAALMLVHRPAQLFDVGFQLSYAAVAAIVLLGPQISARLAREGRRPGFLAQSVGISTAATAGTAPIVVWTFGYVPMAGIVLNIIAVPLASAALAAGLLMVIAFPLSATIATLFAQTADASTELILCITDFADRRLSTSVLVASSNPYKLIVALALTFAATTHIARFDSRWRWSIVLAILAFAANGLSTVRSVARSQTLDVVFVDVGQGDGAVIRTPGGAFLVVDTGPPGRQAAPAERSMVPLLRSMGARGIDALVLSHPHADHDGGFDALADNFEISVVLNNGLEQVPGQLPSRHGTTLKFAGGVSAEVLSPPDTWPRDRSVDDIANNHSVVLRLDYGSVCFLFAGDIEAEAEYELVNRNEDVACEVVKVPHHGSRSSSTWPFVRATESDDANAFAVLSVGARNRFGHPSSEVVERWEQAGRTVVSTSDGARWFKSDGSRVWLHQWR